MSVNTALFLKHKMSSTQIYLLKLLRSTSRVLSKLWWHCYLKTIKVNNKCILSHAHCTLTSMTAKMFSFVHMPYAISCKFVARLLSPEKNVHMT